MIDRDLRRLRWRFMQDTNAKVVSILQAKPGSGSFGRAQMKKIRIGAGAGFSGDRIEPAVELAEKGHLDFLVFECLAERTIALSQLRKREDPNAGYDPLLAERMHAILPACCRNGVRVISNMGAANPRAAARQTIEIARRLGLHGLRIACIEGDDVLFSKMRSGPSTISRFPLTRRSSPRMHTWALTHWLRCWIAVQMLF